MNDVVITGIKSNIALKFISMLSSETVHGIRVENIKDYLHADRYLFCHGLLVPKQSKDQTAQEKHLSKYLNYQSIVDAVDKILEVNNKARICIIGSESGYSGSFDDTYAKYKNLLHNYIESTKLRTEHQQLVGLAPTIIEDTKMTQSRTDSDVLDNKRENHPMKRFLQSSEVAEMIYTLLYKQPYINRTVIRMHGGNIK